MTADEIADPTVLTLTTRVNGEVKQHASNRDLIYSMGELISYYSGFYTSVRATSSPAERRPAWASAATPSSS